MTAIQDIETRLNQFIGLDAGSLGPSAISAAARMRMRKRGVKQTEDYAVLLAASEAELQELVEEVVVSETWFFRDRQPFFALARWAAETWLPARPQGVLRLLSGPCATGEEPFSMVMALLDAGVPPERFVVEAVDISLTALNRARQGVYGRNSFRGTELEFREHYFKPEAEGWRLNESVRRQVQFRQANLLDPLFIAKAGIKDVIFCRNMLIYFDEPAQHRLVTALDNLLSPDGLLFVGHAEGFVFRNSDFVPAQMPMAFALHKRGNEPAEAEIKPRQRVALKLPAVAHRKTGGLSVPPHVTVSPVKQRDQLSRDNKTVTATSQPKASPVSDLAAELAEAQRLADAGQFESAITKCNACLHAHGPSSQAFYLLGLVNDAAGKAAVAGDFYRKAVYLEPDQYEALAQLSLLAKKSGDTAAARQWSQRARRAHDKLSLKTQGRNQHKS